METTNNVDTRSMAERLADFLDSEEGKKSMEEFFQKQLIKEQIEKSQTERLKRMFTDQESFDALVEKILAKHDDAYIDGCYAKGYMPHPRPLLYCLFNLAENEGTESEEGFDDFTNNWPTMIFNYMNWGFTITHGQGSVCSVYKDGELKYRD